MRLAVHHTAKLRVILTLIHSTFILQVSISFVLQELRMKMSEFGREDKYKTFSLGI